MADTTTRYGFPYQEATDAPDGALLGQDLAEAVELSLADVEDAADTRLDALEATLSDRSEYVSTTAISPLTSSTNSDTLIATLSHTFKNGYAYKISWEYPAAITGGTSPFIVYTKIKRTNASGTEIRGTAGTAAVTTNVIAVNGSTVVKRTGGSDTTQTIALVGGMSTSGSPTSVGVSALSNRPIIFRIERIGTSAQFSNALEVPTA